MSIEAVKILNNLRPSASDAQGLSPLGADTARFAKTLNDLLITDPATKPTAGTGTAVADINDLRTKAIAKTATPPLRDQNARVDVVAKARLTPQGELEQKAKELVGTTFYATLLKQMHDSPFKSELFSGGRGGEAFGGMYDQVLAQRMSQRNADRIVRPIVKKFEKAAADAYERQNRQNQSLNEAKKDVPNDRRA